MKSMGPVQATTVGIDYIDMADDRRGYCYCCGRIGFKLNTAGLLSRHGYTRPGYGYDIGGCEGSHQSPAATLDIAIRWQGHHIARLDQLLASDLVAFTIKQVRDSQRSVDQRYGRNAYSRSRCALELRKLRDGEPCATAVVWRRMFATQVSQHRRELARLVAVKISI